MLFQRGGTCLWDVQAKCAASQDSHGRPIFYRGREQFGTTGVNLCVRYIRCARGKHSEAPRGPQMLNLTTLLQWNAYHVKIRALKEKDVQK